jgi:hypothetical protein
VAVTFGGQKNEVFDSAAGVANFRLLLQEVRVGLWRADVLAGFDCLAHGGLFVAIGEGGSVRHLAPPDEKPRSEQPFSHMPSVLIPDLLC